MREALLRSVLRQIFVDSVTSGSGVSRNMCLFLSQDSTILLLEPAADAFGPLILRRDLGDKLPIE